MTGHGVHAPDTLVLSPNVPARQISYSQVVVRVPVADHAVVSYPVCTEQASHV